MSQRPELFTWQVRSNAPAKNRPTISQEEKVADQDEAVSAWKKRWTQARIHEFQSRKALSTLSAHFLSWSTLACRMQRVRDRASDLYFTSLRAYACASRCLRAWHLRAAENREAIRLKTLQPCFDFWANYTNRMLEERAAAQRQMEQDYMRRAVSLSEKHFRFRTLRATFAVWRAAAKTSRANVSLYEESECDNASLMQKFLQARAQQQKPKPKPQKKRSFNAPVSQDASSVYKDTSPAKRGDIKKEKGKEKRLNLYSQKMEERVRQREARRRSLKLKYAEREKRRREEEKNSR